MSRRRLTGPGTEVMQVVAFMPTPSREALTPLPFVHLRESRPIMCAVTLAAPQVTDSQVRRMNGQS